MAVSSSSVIPTPLAHADTLGEGETFLLSRVNEKSAHFCVTVKKRTEVVCPPPPIPPNRHHDDRIASWEEKGEPGHHVTCVISVKKLDDCSLLRLVNLPIFLLGSFPPHIREHLSTVV
ncbi:hypothetical protein TNCV_1431561 [Trichonephila clavipes]|nr:hypothetical protein TNCV_1431561 [Trichonephila clavipes]